MELGGTRLGKFSLAAGRAFVGGASVPCAVSVVNHYLGWGLFGRDDRWSIGLSFVLLFLVMRYLGPTMQQLREYRQNDRAGRQPPGT